MQAAIKALWVAMTFSYVVAVLLTAWGCLGGAPDPKVVQATDDGLKTALCVLDHYAADKAAGMSDLDIAGDIATSCGVDAYQTGRVLAAHRRATSDAGVE